MFTKHRTRFTAAIGPLAACGLILGAANLRAADILPEGWEFRRPLNFKPATSDAPGPNAAVAEFYTNGEARPDGADLRVTNAQRVNVPFKIMQFSRDNDFVRLAFATPGDGPYDVWWGNPRAAAPDKPLDIKRGIYTEILRTPGVARRDVRTPEALEKLFERAQPPIGAVFVPEIFLAYNPLGPEWDTMFHYTAQFKIDHAITAQFAFTVANSGALAIDGKTIAHEVRGGIRGQVRDPKTVNLAVGWHSIDVTQVNLDGGQTGVVVAWKRPGDRGYSPLPAAIFAPVATAAAGPLEKVGAASSYAADFFIAPEAESFCPPNSYLPRYVFEARFPASFNPKLQWDFGDGQTAGDLKRVNHIYLVPGNYTVKLRVSANGNVFDAARRITVPDRMYSKYPRPPEDRERVAADVLRDDNLQHLTAEQALRGMLFFKGHGDTESTIRWGLTWAGMKEAPHGVSTFDEAFDLARLLEDHKRYPEAAQVFHEAAAKSVSMDERVKLMRFGVMTACDCTDNAANALAEAQKWSRMVNENSASEVRGVEAAIIYAAIAAGDAKLAQSTITQAAGKQQNLGRAYNDRQIRQGVLARNIENYIRTKDYDTALKLIDDWDVEFPDAIWEGFTRTLRVKLAAAEGRPAIAARTALALAKVNSDGFYAAELLYRASENFKAAGDTTQSKAALDLLTSKYPESPYARGDKKE